MKEIILKLSEQLRQDHECGDFGKALAGYSERAEALENEVERLRVQLAGCGVAAMCNTSESREKQKCVAGDFGWSQSYQDVFNAVEREIQYRELCDKLRDAIRRILDSPPLLSEIANEALQPESV